MHKHVIYVKARETGKRVSYDLRAEGWPGLFQVFCTFLDLNKIQEPTIYLDISQGLTIHSIT